MRGDVDLMSLRSVASAEDVLFTVAGEESMPNKTTRALSAIMSLEVLEIHCIWISTSDMRTTRTAFMI